MKKNVEIQTIIEAMVKKQTWVRNELKTFLELWKDITQEEVQGHDKFVLYEYYNDEYSYRIYLERSYRKIYKQSYNPYSEQWEDEVVVSVRLSSMTRIRKIIKYITSGLNQYFQDIQNDIDRVDASGTAIRSLTEKLK